MSESTARGRVATWDEYEHLPEDVRSEYIDGQIVVTPFPTPRHSRVVHRLQNVLESGIPDSLITVSHAGWKVGRDEYGPDVMVVPASVVDDVRFEGIPTLVVEVVSTNRATDTVVKVGKYAKAGAPRYWIVDLRDRTLLSLILVDGVYEVAAQLDDDNPDAELETGAGAVRVSLRELLG